MQNREHNMACAENQYYIDKTSAMEKGIEVFPSIYIEGAAASGKTTAVKMLLARHPEVRPLIFDMREKQNPEEFGRELQELSGQMESGCWFIFENLDKLSADGAGKIIADFIFRMPGRCRAILTGRERPGEELLALLWKRKMELFPQEILLFTKEEVRRLVEETESTLNPEKLYEITGGWAGCVDLMIRLSRMNAMCGKTRMEVEELRRSYEVETYIREEILGSLSEEEQEMMRRAAVCSWLDGRICREVWGYWDAEELLERLERKGLLTHSRRKKQWKIAPLFKQNLLADEGQQVPHDGLHRHLGQWYEMHGFLKAALEHLKRSGDEMLYRTCMAEHYEQIPFLGIPYGEVMQWREKTPEICYLRGMYCYSRQDFKGLDREISRVEKWEISRENAMEPQDRGWICRREILLNLYFVKPDFSLDGWMDMLAAESEKAEENMPDGEWTGFRIYSVLGNSYTFLCGLRDLSGLFACAKKEENRKARIWRNNLGEEEWKCYQMARMDYYLETERKDAVSREDWEVLESDFPEGPQNSEWRFDLARLYLMDKLQRIEPERESTERVRALGEILVHEENIVCVKSAEALLGLYSPWRQETEKLTQWLRYSEDEAKAEVTEENYMILCCLAKGYLFLNQYDRAGKILKRLIPYLQTYRRMRLLAELLFQQAVISWEGGRHSQALQYMIESFLVTGESRYVGFYAGYGKKGKEVFEAYIEWMKANSPEGWHRKKKYHYGNVLRMPWADYLGVILRCMKREARNSQLLPDEMMEERLTMMETIILQSIGRGLTNAEICEELNLKLPTVKSHIYSLYKKLGANSRVQAILKGKEMGILD